MLVGLILDLQCIECIFNSSYFRSQAMGTKIKRISRIEEIEPNKNLTFSR